MFVIGLSNNFLPYYCSTVKRARCQHLSKLWMSPRHSPNRATVSLQNIFSFTSLWSTLWTYTNSVNESVNVTKSDELKNATYKWLLFNKHEFYSKTYFPASCAVPLSIISLVPDLREDKNTKSTNCTNETKYLWQNKQFNKMYTCRKNDHGCWS